MFNGTHFIQPDSSLFMLEIYSPTHRVTRSTIWDGIQSPEIVAQAILSKDEKSEKIEALTQFLRRTVTLFEGMTTQEIRAHGYEAFALRNGYFLSVREILPDSDMNN